MPLRVVAGQDSLDEIEGSGGGFDFAVELGVADEFQEAGELGAGGEAVVDQIGAVDKRRAG